VVWHAASKTATVVAAIMVFIGISLL